MEKEKLEFYKAFRKCQGLLDPVKTDSTNPHFDSKYASLSAVMEAVKPFIEGGFSFIQGGADIAGKPYLRTKLVHDAGWEEVFDYPIVSDGNPQHAASSVTYARRYAICAIVGLCVEDDDGNNAASVKTVTREPAQTRTSSPESSGFEVARFVPSRVDFVEGKGKGAGKTFSEVYRADGAKFSGNEQQGEIAEAARVTKKEIILEFEKKGNYMNIKRDGIKFAEDSKKETEIEEIPF